MHYLFEKCALIRKYFLRCYDYRNSSWQSMLISPKKNTNIFEICQSNRIVSDYEQYLKFDEKSLCIFFQNKATFFRKIWYIYAQHPSVCAKNFYFKQLTCNESRWRITLERESSRREVSDSRSSSCRLLPSLIVPLLFSSLPPPSLSTSAHTRTQPHQHFSG